MQGHALTTKKWLAIFSAYIAALLCWPSAVLFIFWPLYIERHEPNKKRLIIAAALAALISGSYLMYTMSRGSDYDMTSAVSQSDKQSANQSDKHSVARQPINFLMQSIGRGAFDLILPYRLVPYSKLDSSINWIGWLVAVFVGLFLALNFKKNAALAMPKNSSENSAAVTANKYRQYKVKGEGSAAAINFEKDKFRALFLLMGLLFAPQMMVFLNYYEFVWADRYLFSTLPYMAIIMAISLQRLSQRTLVVGAVFVVAAFVIIDFDLRSFWQNAFKLFSHCVESENNPKCIMMAVESSFDAAGCEAMQPVFKAARTHISSIDQSDFVFRYEMPLYEGICVTRSSAAIDEQRRQLKDLESLYGERNALVFPLALVEFEQKRVDLAYAYARETIFNPEFKFGVVTPRVADIFRGQAQMTCVLADMLLHNKECMGLARQLDERLSKVKADPDHINWAQGEVQRAYNKK